MTSDQLRAGWAPRRIGRRILVLDEVDSTNRLALELAEEPDGDGLAVLADFQTAGRGRQGRVWLSPRGASVLCSAVLITGVGKAESASGLSGSASAPRSAGGDVAGPDLGGPLTLGAAVAGCEAVRRATEVAPSIRWPNDVQVGGRKLGGILVESRALPDRRRAWVVGIGVNCLQQKGHFPPELQANATSLELVAAHGVDRVAVARELLRSLDGWIGDAPDFDRDRIRAAWLQAAEPVGQRVRLIQAGQEYVGRTLDVDPAGGLIVQGDEGWRRWFDPLLTRRV